MKKTTARKMLREIEAMQARLYRAFDLLGDDESSDTADLEEVRLALHQTNSATSTARDTLKKAFDL